MKFRSRCWWVLRPDGGLRGKRRKVPVPAAVHLVRSLLIPCSLRQPRPAALCCAQNTPGSPPPPPPGLAPPIPLHGMRCSLAPAGLPQVSPHSEQHMKSVMGSLPNASEPPDLALRPVSFPLTREATCLVCCYSQHLLFVPTR